MHDMILESKGLRMEIALVFLVPGFIYFLASDLRFSHSLQIDRSVISLVAMIIMMLWFVYRRITELQAEIRQRQKVETILKEVEERYRALFDRSLDFVFIYEFDGKFIDANNVMLDRLGYSLDELKAMSFSQVLPKDEQDRSQILHAEILDTGYQREIAQFKMKQKNGEFIDIEVRASIIIRWGEPFAIQGIARDITDRVEAEKALQTAHQKLQEAMEQLKASQEQLLQSEKLAAVGQLVSGVAHELNNPLMAISGYSEIISLMTQDKEISKYANSLHDESGRAIGIVKNLLSFARKQEVRLVPISIFDVINSVVSLRSYELRVDNIMVQISIPPTIPAVIGDFQQLQQVFLNLLIDAEQAICDSGIGETISIESYISDDSISIIFSDDGPGIPPDTLGRIFEPFFTTKEVGKGTGLGLSICYGIIQNHEGTISCTSAEGKGTTFIIELPIAQQIREKSEDHAVITIPDNTEEYSVSVPSA